MKLIIFADAWGAKYGGINTFNYDFCKALGKLNKINIHIYCVNATNSDIEEAAQYNIILENVTEIDFKNFNFNYNKLEECDDTYWVGHDTKTGKQAIKAKEQCKFGKIIIFNHMNYAETAQMKNSTSIAHIKKKEQIEIFKQADIIYCVGPKLYRGMIDDKNNFNYKAKIKEILPGMIENNINPHHNTNSFNILVSGRIEENNDRIKQIKTAIFSTYAIAKYNDLSLNLTLIGANSIEDAKRIENELKHLLDEKYDEKNYMSLLVYPYSENRQWLFDMIRKSSVCLMLSLSEGFGLVGLEAIASGVPLIISENSGLFEFLETNGLAFFVHPVKIQSANETDINETDIKKVSNILIKLANNQKSAKKLALMLYDILKDKLSWEKTAISFLAELISDFKYQLKETVFLPDELFDISLEGNIFKANKGFETMDFYKYILSYAEKRLWIYGRKNRKLFSNDNNYFFNNLGRKKQNGYDFRCLFQDYNSPDKVLDIAQDITDFKSRLKISLFDALQQFEDNELDIKDFCKIYNTSRNIVIIIADDKIIIHKVTRKTNKKPNHLTGQQFYILNQDSLMGKNYIEEFEKVWKKSKKLTKEYIKRIK